LPRLDARQAAVRDFDHPDRVQVGGLGR
jgi:hypothetical protein